MSIQSPVPDQVSPRGVARSPHWIAGLLIVAIAIGLAARVIHLEEKFFWVDEVHTTIRISGYTKEAVTDAIFQGQPIPVASLRQYQRPNPQKDLGDVLNALAQHPEHPPLYYLMARLWVQLGALGGDPGIGWLRHLSVGWGLLALPAVYWLCWELFSSHLVASLALMVVAVSPLHIFYAQEAREYSLWTVTILAASAALLRALGHPNRQTWSLYGLTLVLGLYTHLLFGLVAIAHGIYLVALGYWRQPAIRRGYGRVLAIAFLAFLPWAVVGGQQLGQIRAVADATAASTSLDYLVGAWSRNLNRVFFGTDLASANLLLVMLTLWAGYALVRHTPRRVWLLMVALVGVNALALMIPDLLVGGIRSVRIRYLIPAYLGLQITVAHLFALQICHIVRWRRFLGRGLVALVLTGSVVAAIASIPALVNWTKSDKAPYYPQIVQAISAGDRPLIISDTSATYVLALSDRLQPDHTLLLVNRPQELKIPPGYGDLFLFDPSPRLRRVVARRVGRDPQLVIEQSETFQLWQVSP
ncbi:MAG: glycosyltransferase family 39 protein [Synechococcales bacterium]|nr:glycosyltransferase family 39 protein [Synechococcales bacterium]